jgi:hypothetical protein
MAQDVAYPGAVSKIGGHMVIGGHRNMAAHIGVTNSRMLRWARIGTKGALSMDPGA